MSTPVSSAAAPDAVNVAKRLSEHAQRNPAQLAVVEPIGRDAAGRYRYRHVTYAELDEDSNRLANGLCGLGVTPGTRLTLLVRPGIDFVSLVFALFKSGAVTILVDPGMGRRNLLRCLAEAEPEGFVAIPPVHAVRCVMRRRFPKSRLHVTVGRRWFWGGATIDQLRRDSSADALRLNSQAEDPAAIIFTTGSTGVPKGVLYRHGNFANQVAQIQEQYGIQPGAVDLAGFPLFGLFNSGMGVTTIIPDMDATRPAAVDPENIIAAVNDWKVTQSFGSPALWNRVARYCESRSVKLPTLRQVFSAGAPVPGHVLARLKACLPEGGEIHTPYGATEALPVATIEAGEVLDDTQSRTDEGAGVCVGRRFSGIEWKVVEIHDGPLPKLDNAVSCPTGQIGELIVCGPVVTRQYVTRIDANSLGKIHDGVKVWHRMGDVGYLDEDERFWFCGRMAHRVRTNDRVLYTIPCEAVFNTHAAVYRTALVGIGPAGSQRPVLVVEPHAESFPNSDVDRTVLIDELRALGAEHPHTAGIHDFLIHQSLPVDIRHNAKIFREKLAPWAARRLDS